MNPETVNSLVLGALIGMGIGVGIALLITFPLLYDIGKEIFGEWKRLLRGDRR